MQTNLIANYGLTKKQVLCIVKEWYEKESNNLNLISQKGQNLENILIEQLEKYKDVPEKETHKCPYCDASMKKHWQRLSKGLAKSLVKFRSKVIELNRNKIHIKDDIDFTKTEFNNFQKLRYHGLVAKCKNTETGLNESGYWLLTKRGNLFCKNQLSIPVGVLTFRNKIREKTKDFCTIKDVLKEDGLPYWDEKDDFTFKFADIYDYEEIVQDINGQTLLFI